MNATQTHQLNVRLFTILYKCAHRIYVFVHTHARTHTHEHTHSLRWRRGLSMHMQMKMYDHWYVAKRLWLKKLRKCAVKYARLMQDKCADNAGCQAKMNAHYMNMCAHLRMPIRVQDCRLHFAYHMHLYTHSYTYDQIAPMLGNMNDVAATSAKCQVVLRQPYGIFGVTAAQQYEATNFSAELVKFNGHQNQPHLRWVLKGG